MEGEPGYVRDSLRGKTFRNDEVLEKPGGFRWHWMDYFEFAEDRFEEHFYEERNEEPEFIMRGLWWTEQETGQLEAVLKLSMEEFIGPVPVNYEMEFAARVEKDNPLLNDKLYVDVTQTQAVNLTI